MKIIVDAMGGDNAPEEIVKGCALAAAEYGVDIVLCGNEEKIREAISQNQLYSDRFFLCRYRRQSNRYGRPC